MASRNIIHAEKKTKRTIVNFKSIEVSFYKLNYQSFLLSMLYMQATRRNSRDTRSCVLSV